MDASLFLNRFLKQIRNHPNVTCLKMDNTLITNARFAQYIAPIMNEFDSVSDSSIALLMERSVYTYAAVFAASFGGKKLIPILESWSDDQRMSVLEHAGLPSCLTAQRMGYYYWMTVEDALDRMDNGLVDLQNDQVVADLYDFDAAGNVSSKPLLLAELLAGQNDSVKYLGHEVLDLFTALSI